MNRATRTLAQAALCLLLTTGITTALHAQDDAPPQEAGRGQGGGAGRGRGRGVRGTVLSTSGANVTIKTETGETWTVVTTDNTRVNIDRQTVKVAEIKAGDEVAAMGMPDNDKHEIHAMMLIGASAAQAAKLKADMGKTYIVGKITAINDTKLTVMRADKISQTITLDDSTSLHRGGRMGGEAMMSGMMGGPGGGGFGGGQGGGGGRRRGEGGTPNATSGGDPASDQGESITLADVKVGDNIGGTGSLKGGVFVPTDLQVATPRPRGERGPGAPPQQ